MHNLIHAMPTSGTILVLTEDQPSERQERQLAIPEFESRPFANATAAPSSRSRFIDDAEDWGRCRAFRLLLEEQLALQEECYLIDPETAAGIRSDMSRIERHVGDVPVEHVLAALAGLQGRLYDDEYEAEWS